MAITITIQGTPISFPQSGSSPDWAPAIVQFAQAVEQALSSTTGPYDVSPQSFDISSLNPGSPNVDIPNLAFSTSAVRAAWVKYTVFRTADSPTSVAYEQGNILVVYNSSSGTWEISQDLVGDAQVSFNITNSGQIQITCTQIGTVNHSGKIVYSATALEQ